MDKFDAVKGVYLRLMKIWLNQLLRDWQDATNI